MREDDGLVLRLTRKAFGYLETFLVALQRPFQRLGQGRKLFAPVLNLLEPLRSCRPGTIHAVDLDTVARRSYVEIPAVNENVR